MSTTTIAPATPDRFDDAEHALTGGGDGATCQCQWWTIPNARWRETSVADRTDMLRSEMESAPPPGLIAYVDGEAAGWIRVGSRAGLARAVRTRAIVGATQEPLDDPGVWSVSCFVVRKEHRRRGLNAVMLDAAVAFARENGARVVEAYPIDTAVAKHSSNQLFHGVLPVFLAAGFREVARPRPDLVLVSLALA